KTLVDRSGAATDRAEEEALLNKAEQVLQQSPAGEPGEKMLKLIADKREVGKHNEWTSAIIRQSRLENGQVDEAAVWRVVAQQDGETQKKLSPIVTQYLAHERKAWDE